jgi:hypothetical protein
MPIPAVALSPFSMVDRAPVNPTVNWKPRVVNRCCGGASCAKPVLHQVSDASSAERTGVFFIRCFQPGREEGGGTRMARVSGQSCRQAPGTTPV